MPESKNSFSSDSSSQKNISDFVNTLSYLKKKIGFPEAQSTPHNNDNKKEDVPLITETPVVSNLERRPRNVNALLDDYQKSKENESNKIQTQSNQTPTEAKKPIHNQLETKENKKSVSLFVTKPIFVECISSPPKTLKGGSIKQTSVDTQTDPFLGKDLLQTIEKHSVVENQALKFCEHSDSDPDAVSTQTGSELVESNCNSFKYVKNLEAQKPPPTSHMQKSQNTVENMPILSMKEQTDDYDDISISSNVSDDIEKNSLILQKLLRSKKYDKSTKRRYIKRILQKIMESKYLEESSNSSELFLPKRMTTDVTNLAAPPTTDSSSKSAQGQDTLQSCSTPCSQCYKISPRKRKQTNKTLTTAGTKTPVSREGIYITSTNEGEATGKNISVAERERFAVQHNKIKTSSLENASNSTSEKQSINSSSKSELKYVSYQNWKEDKTYSEKLFEASPSSNGDGDYLNLIGSKERQNQINWINNEIDQLGKMKYLLQKHGLKELISQKKPQKFTSVYIVSDDNDHSDGIKKKYVIETNLGARSSVNRKYKVGERNYSVKEISEPVFARNESGLRDIFTAGDIEIVPSEEALNIKVTTFCGLCKRSPCICAIASGNNSKFIERPLIRNGAKDSISSKNTKSNMATFSCCHKKNPSAKTSQVEIGKHCPLCDLYHCKCSEQINSQGDFYNGKFIQSLPEKQNVSSSIKDSLLPDRQNYTIPKIRSNFGGEPVHTSEIVEQGGSLKRVFENCLCKSKSTCDCGFVEKLFRHFKGTNELESLKIQPKTDNIAVQTESNLISTENPISIQCESTVPQSEKELCFETVGVQCHVEVQDVSLQMSKDLKSSSSQTHVELQCKGKENLQVHGSEPAKTFHSQYQQTSGELFSEDIEDGKLNNIENVVKACKDYISQENGSKVLTDLKKFSSDNSRTTSKSNERNSSKQKDIQSTPSVLNSVTSSTAISPYGR